MEKNAFADLAAALRERLAVIADEKSRREPDAHMARLKQVAERIEELTSALPCPIDPQLAHYLQRQSYDKALDFIESTTQRSAAR
jgi:hypothetical protein